MHNFGTILRPWGVLVALVLLGPAARGDDPPPRPPSPHETPIGRFLERVFEGIGDTPQGETVPAETPPNEQPAPTLQGTERIIPDAIDERAAAGRVQQRDLILARRLLNAGEPAAAITLLQGLLDAPEDSLLLRGDGNWESLQGTVEQLIGADQQLRQQYGERFAALAEEQLQLAKQSGEPGRLADVTRRFLHTPAGQEAARILASVFRDAGEPVEATYWSQRLDSSAGAPRSPVRNQPSRRQRPPSADWPQPFGGPTHRGTFADTDPVLIERWRQPITARPAIAEQIDLLVSDLVDNGDACVPVAMPLAVGPRIITRTLRGLSAFDAETGRLLWESAEGVSAERLLAGEDAPAPGGEPPGRNTRAVPAYRGGNPDGHPLAGLLFRDGVYGLISSDGKQVFVLEDHASLSYRQPGYFWGQRIEDDPFERDWATNRLTAYDLETGAVRWRIGGERLNEPFDAPLAGTLFLGPPVIDRDELFIIGERDATMLLFVLDRRTGQPLWSHTICDVGAEIQQDLVRRWWPAQPAVGPGVVICPSTAGWLVAIDRLGRRIRWAYRYIEARQKPVGPNRPRVAAAGPLNARWCPSAPVLTQRHVVFTPQELPDPLYGDQPRVVCLDVLTGERIWWEEKDSLLYLAGAVEDRAVFVGKDVVEARDLSTGRRLWQTRLSAAELAIPTVGDADDATNQAALASETPQPSGRGIIVGDALLLPLQSGQLLRIDVQTGELLKSVALRSDARPLGNLLVHAGRLVSVGPFAVRCFEERGAIAAELAATDAPAPATSLLRAGELQFIEGDFASARTTLQTLRADELAPSARSRADQLLWDTLVQLVRRDLHAADAEFAELSDLAITEDRRLMVDHLRADRLLARGQRIAAFNVFWQRAQTPQPVSVREGETEIRLDRWLSGRLSDLWQSCTEEERLTFDDRISQTVETALAADDAPLTWWAEVLRFHPAGAKVRRALAERAIEERRWTAAEITLLQILDEAEDDELQAWAFGRLIALTIEQQREHDALAYVEQYGHRIPDLDVVLSPFIEKLPGESRIAVPAWSDGTWQLTRSPASFNRSMFEPMLAIQAGLPSIEALNLRIEPNLHRLAIEKLNGESLWETPLLAQSQSFYNQTTGICSVGPLLFVVHHGVLHAAGLADRELLWRRTFDAQGASAGYVRAPTLVRQQELRELRSFLWTSGLRQSRSPMGMLAVWRPGYVAWFGRHTVTISDPLTGESLWTRGGISPRTMVYGTARTVYVVPPVPEAPYALNVLDGSGVDASRLKSLVGSSVAVLDEGFVMLDERQPFRLFGWGQPAVRLRLVDPADAGERWSLSLPDGTRFAQLSDAEILAVDPDGGVQLVDCRRGQLRPLGTVGEDVMQGVQRLYAAAEWNRVYLAFNQPPKPGSYSRSYQSAPVQGTLAGFDLHGGLLWSVAVEDQNLTVDQLPQLPVLVLTAQRPERDGDVTSQQVFVELRDKETGELLLQDARYITGGNVREMEIDHAHQFIDLKTYNDRLRLETLDN